MNHKKFYIELGSRIKEKRKKLELTQEILAKEINISRTALANIEAGRQQLLVHQLYLICSVLEISIETILPKLESGLIDAKLPDDLTKKQKEEILKLINSVEAT